jgi:hypothetical protein
LEQFARKVVGIAKDDDPSFIDIDEKIVEELAPQQVTLEKTKKNPKALVAFIVEQPNITPEDELAI